MLKIQNKLGIVQWLLYIGLAIVVLLLGVTSALIAFTQGLNHDESLFLQVPSNLVKQGSYSTTYDGGGAFDPWVTTGPTVLLPIGLVFKYFGINIYQARTISLIYFLLMIASAFLLSCRLYGISSALITTTIIPLLPHMFFFGLIVLGEVPAAFYLLFAVLLLTKGKPFLSGVSMGLAVLTKLVFALLVVPLSLLFGLEFILSIKSRRKNTLLFYSLMAFGVFLPNLIWEIVKLLSLGWAEYKDNVRVFLDIFKLAANSQAVSSPHFFSRIQVLSTPFNNIPSMIVLALLVLAITHNLLATLQQLKKGTELTDQGRSKLFLVLFSITSLTWWISGRNSGLWRHLFPSYIVLLLPVGNSFASLVKVTVGSNQEPLKRGKWRSLLLHLAVFAITLYLIIFALFLPAQSQIVSIKEVLSSELLASQIKIASEVSKITQEGGIIAYWGWWQSPEISFLVQTQFWNVGDSKTRNKLNDLTKQGDDVFVLVSPVQKEFEPQAWSDEKIFCGKLIIENAGYELFEYVPSYDWTNQYRYLIERGDIATLPSSYNLNNQSALIGYSEGIYGDGWIARRAFIWLSNDPKHTTLTIEGSVNLDYYDQEPISAHVSIMDARVAEPVLSHSGDFVWKIDLPDRVKSYDAIRIMIEPSHGFVPKTLGINDDLRELSIMIRHIGLRQIKYVGIY